MSQSWPPSLTDRIEAFAPRLLGLPVEEAAALFDACYNGYGLIGGGSRGGTFQVDPVTRQAVLTTGNVELRIG